MPSPAAGDFAGPVDIGGGRHLFLVCRRSGRPTVMLESGYHDSSSLWSVAEPIDPGVHLAVLPAIATEHRVCAYDRPGTLDYDTSAPTVTTRSSPVSMPRTGLGVADDLHAVLTAGKLPTPVILVAHSIGGLFVLTFARKYPQSVVGIVLVDSFAPSIITLFGKNWPVYRTVLTGAGPSSDPHFESIDVDVTVADLERLPPLRRMPLVVIDKTEPFALPKGTAPAVVENIEPIWKESRQGLVQLEPNTPEVIATGSDHYIQVREPDLVSGAVTLVSGRIAR